MSDLDTAVKLGNAVNERIRDVAVAMNAFRTEVELVQGKMNATGIQGPPAELIRRVLQRQLDGLSLLQGCRSKILECIVGCEQAKNAP